MSRPEAYEAVIRRMNTLMDQLEKLLGEDQLKRSRRRRRSNLNPYDRWREIVGVVGDVRLMGLDVDVNPTMYVPLPQNPYRNAPRNVLHGRANKG